MTRAPLFRFGPALVAAITVTRAALAHASCPAVYEAAELQAFPSGSGADVNCPISIFDPEGYHELDAQHIVVEQVTANGEVLSVLPLTLYDPVDADFSGTMCTCAGEDSCQCSELVTTFEHHELWGAEPMKFSSNYQIRYDEPGHPAHGVLATFKTLDQLSDVCVYTPEPAQCYECTPEDTSWCEPWGGEPPVDEGSGSEDDSAGCSVAPSNGTMAWWLIAAAVLLQRRRRFRSRR